MEKDVEKRFDFQDQLLEKMYNSVEKTRKYFMWTLIISGVMFLIPLIILIFVLPGFIDGYISALGGI